MSSWRSARHAAAPAPGLACGRVACEALVIQPRASHIGAPYGEVLKDAYPDKAGEQVLVPLRDHRYDLDALLDAVTLRTKVVYVCNPNNPTGRIVPRHALREIVRHASDQVIGFPAFVRFVVNDEVLHSGAEMAQEFARASRVSGRAT